MYLRLSDGVRVFVDVEGGSLRPRGRELVQVPTLLLVHGGPGFDHATLRPYFTAWRESYQIIYFDQRGMGRSDDGPADRWTVDRWAADLGEVIERLGLVCPIVLGHSFGGCVAMRYAASRSHELAGLILSSTCARHVPEDCLGVLEDLGGAGVRDVARRFFDDPTCETFAEYRRVCFPLYSRAEDNPVEASWPIVKPEVLIDYWRGEHRSLDLRDGLREVACPTLVISGERDPITPVARAREIASELRATDAELVIVPDAGHGVWRDKPHEYERVVQAFVTRASELPRWQ